MFRNLIAAYKLRRRKKLFREGAELTRFLAPDIRRDIEVVDISELASGFIVARVRTWNVLHTSRGLTPKPEFSAPKRLKIDDLWKWNGAQWGGSVPVEDLSN